MTERMVAMTKKILLIDDESAFCDMVKENVELRGEYAVRIANNGKEGLKTARRIKPDIILLDIRMPKMDGFKVLEELKKDVATLSIPVIMLSALDDEESKTRSASLYDDMYLVKPVKMAELLSKIEDVLKIRGVK
jgi:DNA-binding response OmpR family regulator